MALLLREEGRGEDEAVRKKANNSDAKTADPYAIFENVSSQFYANAIEKVRSTSLF